MMTSLKDLTIEDVESNAHLKDLPEFYQLRDVVEAQGWHDNQSVFDHCIKSAQSLDEILSFSYLTDEERSKLQTYLDGKFDSYTRRELLVFATLLHDIGKIISLQTNEGGETSSPSHGPIGSWVAKPVVARLDLSRREQSFVIELIADHLLMSDLSEMAINNDTPSQTITDLLLTHKPDSAIEVILLGYADWMGCNVRASVVEELGKRVEIAKECLAQAAQTLN